MSHLSDIPEKQVEGSQGQGQGQALAQPHFNYCCWTITDASPKNSKMGRQPSQIIFDKDELIHTLGWRNLNDQRAISKFKMLHYYFPEYLRNIYRKEQPRFVNLRDNESKLVIPLPRKELYRRSFSYSGGVLWKSLRHYLRTASSLTEFKSQILHHTFQGE